MPFNGSGTFTVVNQFVPNTTILSAAVNQNFTDIATGLSDCLTRDGQAGMTAAFKAIAGSLGAPSITFSADATSGAYLPATGILGLVSHSLGLTVDTTIYQAQSATIQAGGSNYAIGDTITETGGTFTSPAVFTVASLTGSAVASVTVTVPGVYKAKPSNPVSQGSTSGTGSGCTLNITWNDPGASDYRAAILTEASAAIWARLGASSFVSSLMGLANGLDFVTALGASNVAAATGLSAPPPGSSFKNLSIKVATNTTITAAADFVVTTNGAKYQTTALSSTINLGTTGANALDTGTVATSTWYAIFAIAKPDGTTAGLASTSATSPTMPSGYTYKARIGWVRTASGTAQLLGTYQFGRRTQYIVGLAQSTDLPLVATGANTGAWISASVSNFVPPTASIISVTLFGQTNGAGSTQYTKVAPNNSYSLATAPPNAPLWIGGNFTFAEYMTVSGDIILESTNIYSGQINMASGSVSCRGWEDNL